VHGSEPRCAEESNRIVAEGRLRRGAEPASRRIGDPARRVDQLTAAEWPRDRVQREVASAQVVLDRLRAESRHVDVPATGGSDRAPGCVLGGELEGGAARHLRDRARRALLLTSLHRQVGIGDLFTEQEVANRAADDPGLGLLLEGDARGSDGRRQVERVEIWNHSVNSRGTL
jgi:hypothetical protein